MAPLNEAQFQALVGLMTLITECEGGQVIIDDFGANINSVIPEALWCAECTSKLKRITELRIKWGTQRS